MKNYLVSLSNQTKGILYIIVGSLLVLNYLNIIETLNAVVAILGIMLIVAGIMMARFHEKIYLLVRKDSKPTDAPQDQDQNQPPRGW